MSSGFLALAVVFSNCLMSLAAAAASLHIPGTVSFWNSWRWWAASGGIGNLLTTPFLLSWFSWAKTRRGEWAASRAFEGAILLASLALLNFLAFHYTAQSNLFLLLLPYSTFPILLWAALRFGTPGVSSALIVMAGMLIHFAATSHISVFALFQGAPLDIVFDIRSTLPFWRFPLCFWPRWSRSAGAWKRPCERAKRG